MSRFFDLLSRAGAVCCVLAVAGWAQAGAISGISEHTSTGGPLFGPETLIGDLGADWNPTQFKSQSAGGTSKIVDSQLSFTVGDVPIRGIWIWERGDYTLIGVPGAEATATVDMQVFWEVVEIDGQAVEPLDGMQEANFGTFKLSELGIGSSGWEGHLDIDIAGFLADKGVSGTATRVDFTLDNTLATASSQMGASAFIAKKDLDITVHVPEPATASLLGIGMLGIALGLRRRRS